MTSKKKRQQVALDAIQKALSLLRCTHTIVGTDKEDVERFLEEAVQALRQPRKAEREYP